MYSFKFADIGEGIHEGKVGEIFVKVGDKVTDGTDIILVETDKVTTPIASPTNGIIEKILVNVGDTIHVGQELFIINDGSSNSASEPSTPVAEKKQEAPAEEAASVVGQVAVSNNILPSFGNQNTSSNNVEKTDNNILISPVARLMAMENNIDLSTIKGTGPLNRILKDDIISALNNLSSVTKTSTTEFKKATVEGQDEVVETTSMRKAIAKAMKDSWQNVAYTNLTIEVDVTDLWEQRNRFKDLVLKEEGVKITLLPFIVKAIAKSLEAFPLFNAYTDEANNRIIKKGDINIGIAIDTKEGLIVPNIKNANRLSILEIAKQIIDLADRARSKKLKMSDLDKGTFSISNYGSLGVDFGVPVIKYPEVAIAGIGTIRPKIVKDKLHFVERKVMYLTIAADHRWIDGGDIGRFANKIKQLLENFTLLFI